MSTVLTPGTPTPTTPVIKFNISNKTYQRVASLARQAAAIASIVVSQTGVNVGHVNHSVMFSGGALLLILEHFLGDPSTGTPAV
jgi:ABC-type phosphate transport system permease subunit